MSPHRVAALSAALALLAGCAGPIPSLGGGSTTPAHRTDLALGGGARVPTGELRRVAGPARESTRGGGVVPVAAVRHGVARGWDVGLSAAGPTVRTELRHEKVLRHGSTRPSYVFAIAPYVGFLPEGDEGAGDGLRFGLDLLPLAYSVDFGGVYEAWAGPRFAVEHVRGDYALGDATEPASAWGVRAGAIVGLGLGLRRVHVLFELSAYYERWSGDHGAGTASAQSLDAQGLVLEPAFALRVRL